MEKEEFKYELGHDQFNQLIQEIKAVHAFNYKTFKTISRLTSIIVDEQERVCEDKDCPLATKVEASMRDLSGINYKQYKKLQYIIKSMMHVIDPEWKAERPKPKQKEENNGC